MDVWTLWINGAESGICVFLTVTTPIKGHQHGYSKTKRNDHLQGGGLWICFVHGLAAVGSAGNCRGSGRIAGKKPVFTPQIQLRTGHSLWVCCHRVISAEKLDCFPRAQGASPGGFGESALIPCEC